MDINSKKIFFKLYCSVIEIIFLLFLSGILIFGRAISITHITTPFIHVYITEILLFIAVPFIILQVKNLNVLPKHFLIAFYAFFSLGCAHLFFALMTKNIFAFRDIVLSGYMLFFPLTFITFNTERKLKIFLVALITSNILGILSGRLYILSVAVLPRVLADFIRQIKSFNLGVYYGIASAFLISFFYITKKRLFRIFILVLLSVNFYMFIFFGARTLWYGLFIQVLFYFIILKQRFMEMLRLFIPIFLLMLGIFYYLDLKLAKSFQGTIILEKITDIKSLAKDIFFSNNHPRTQNTLIVKEETPLNQNSVVESPVYKETEEIVSANPNTIAASLHNEPASKGISLIVKEETPLNQNSVVESPVYKETEEIVSANPNTIAASLHNEPVVFIHGKKVINSNISVPEFRNPNKDIAVYDRSITRNFPSQRFGNETNFTWRLDIWWQAVKFGLQSPWFGKGFGVYPRYIVWNVYKAPPIHIDKDSNIIPAHNQFVTVFYKMGFVGLFLFIYINISSLIFGWKFIQEHPPEFLKHFMIGLLAALFVWHAIAFFFDVIESPPTSIFLWIIIGLIFATRNIHKNTKK